MGWCLRFIHVLFIIIMQQQGINSRRARHQLPAVARRATPGPCRADSTQWQVTSV